MRIKLTNCRAGFAHGLFKATAFEEGQTPKFGFDAIFTDDTKVFKVVEENGAKKMVPTTMKDVQLAVANEAWKGKGAEVLEDLEASKKSYRNGNKRRNKAGEIYEGYEDTWYVTCKSKARVKIFDRVPKNSDGTENLITEESGKVYSGCYVNVTFDLYAITDPKRKGVFAGLVGVQFVKDGDSFGGGGVAKADEFNDLAEGAEAGDLA